MMTTSKQQQVKWTLTEIKNGVMVQEYDLTKMLQRKDELTILIGRQEDIVDIIQYHDSISRRHAILSFNNDTFDTVSIYDLNSTHGVYINYNKMMPPPPTLLSPKIDNATTASSPLEVKTQQQQLTGGMQIHSGDIIKLGASTRYFVIEQQPSAIQEDTTLNENNAEPERNDQSDPVQNHSFMPNQIDTNDENDVEYLDTNENKASLNSKSMKIQDKDIADTIQDSNDKQQLSIDQIPEKYQKEWNHIVTLKSKVDSIQVENDRINNKKGTGLSSFDYNDDYGSGLTTGQQNQLHRNDERIQQLVQQIEQREEVLYQKVYGSTNNSQIVRTKKRNRISIDDVDDNDDVDDDESTFYDQTTSRSDNDTTNAVETETTLLDKWNSLIQSRNLMQNTIDKTKHNADLVTQKIQQLMNADDQEELFFLQNDLQLAKENHIKAQSDMSSIHTSIKEVKQLLSITSPHLRLNVDNGIIINTKTQNRTTTSSRIVPSQTKTSIASIDSSTCTVANEKSMPPPPNIGIASQYQQKPSSMTVVDDKKSVVLFPQLAPQSLSKKSKVMMTDNINAFSVSSIIGTTATSVDSNSKKNNKTTTTFQHQQQVQHDMTKSNVVDSNNTNHISNKNTAISADSSDDFDSWQAPADQDGSGYTKLNEKFKGRY